MGQGFRSVCLCVLAAAAGCRSPAGPTRLEEELTARWESLSDAASRRAILATAPLRPLQHADYRVGPEDVLSISIFEWQLRDETRTLDVRVSQSGLIGLPLLGRIEVAGKTVLEIQEEITRRLREGEILRQPRVSVGVKEYRSRRVAVLGAVREPGLYTLQRNVATLLDVLSLAGGPGDRAGQVAYVIRPAPAGDLEGGEQILTVDLYELLERGNLALNPVLRHGDIIHVPEAPKFFVFGYVREPGGFPLKRPTTVLDAVALARGLREREASPSDCLLKRRTPTGEVVIPLDLNAIAAGEARNLYLRPGDIIEVRQTATKGILLSLWDTVKSIFSLGFRLF